jgi:dUTP pyrophosphatase
MNSDLHSLPVRLLSPTAQTPKRGSDQAVGYDLRADLGGSGQRILGVGMRLAYQTGIAVAIPPGFYGRVAPRSGLAYNFGIDVLAGVIDPDYRGEIKVILLNTGNEPFVVAHGDRIAQLIIERCVTPSITVVESLDDTVRGIGGFGSTGVG